METATFTKRYLDNKTGKTRHPERVQAVLDRMDREFALKHFRRSCRYKDM